MNPWNHSHNMGNLVSSFANINVGVDLINFLNLRKPTAQYALLDLPFELIHNIFFVWLGCTNGINKQLIVMDRALCNKSLRPILFQYYHAISFEGFLVGRCINTLERKMKWSMQREIKFTEVTLRVLCESDTMEAFFSANGQTLKAVYIKNNDQFSHVGAKLIARHCLKLETLCIENSWISPPVAKIIRKCPLKRLRLRWCMDYLSVAYIQMIGSCRCPSLTDLSILDIIERTHTRRIAKAFPNVTVFEVMYPNEGVDMGTIFTSLFTSWSALHTLKVVSMECPTRESLDAIGLCCPNLQKLHLEECNLRHCEAMLVQLVERTTLLTSLTVHDGNYEVLSPIAQVRIIQTMNNRLEEYCMGTMCYDDSVLQALVLYAPSLVTLELLGVNTNGYKSTTITEVYQHCRLLQHLHLYIGDPNNELFLFQDDNWVVDYEDCPIGPHLIDIGTFCKRIQTLLFQDSFEFRLKDVTYLVEHCPKLKSISINNNSCVR